MVDPRSRIPGLRAESEVALAQKIETLERRLRALESRPTEPAIVQESIFAREGQYLRLQPRPSGLTVTLPEPRPANRGKRIALGFETSNPVTLRAVSGTVNGAAFVQNSTPGTFDAVSDGESGWTVAVGISASGSATDAGYLVDAAHASLPNARVATDSTEIDADTTVANVISWAIRAASVVAGKLSALTGRSVFTKAATGAGALAEVAAGDDQFLGTSGSGDLGFRAVHNAALAADVDWAAVLARDPATDGNNPEISSGDELLLDTGGTASYTQTGDVRASSGLTIAADAGLTLTGGSAVTVNSLGSFLFDASTTGQISTNGTFTYDIGSHMTVNVGGNAADQVTGHWLVYTGATPTLRFMIESNGEWRVGGASGTAGQTIVNQGSNVTPVWANLAMGNLASDVDWAGVLDHDPATDGNNPEISNGDELRFDTAGDGDYTGLAGQILANDGLTIHVDHATGPSYLELGTASNPWVEVGGPFFVATVSDYMLLDAGFLMMTGQSASTPSVSTDRGLYWVDNTNNPTEAKFTDDGNADHSLWYQVSAGRSMTLSNDDQLLFDTAGDADFTGLAGELLANGLFVAHFDADAAFNCELGLGIHAGNNPVTSIGNNDIVLNADGGIALTAGGTQITDAPANDVTIHGTGAVSLTAGHASHTNVGSSDIGVYASGGVAIQSGGTPDSNVPNSHVSIISVDGIALHAGATTAGTTPTDDTVLVSGGFLCLSEQSASTPTIAAGQGALWVRDDAPNVLMYTDDTNVDHQVGLVGSTSSVLLEVHSISSDDASISVTPPSGATWFEAEGVAAGGGGGGADADSNPEACAGGGGGGGAWGRVRVAIASGNITGSVGAAGAGGSASGGSGSDGGDTNISYDGGLILSLSGGFGGDGCTAGAQPTEMHVEPGGQGGTAGTLSVNGEKGGGDPGAPGISFAGASIGDCAAAGGAGGGSFYAGGGAGGARASSSGSSGGGSAISRGAGGGGGARLSTGSSSGISGGDGQDGQLVIKFYSGPVPTESAIS